MRRIGRWMLNGLTVLSLVLCVAIVAVWACGAVVWRAPGQGIYHAHDGAGLVFKKETWFVVDAPLNDPGTVTFQISPFLAGGAATLLAGYLLPLIKRWKEHQRRVAGLCVRCGYNLTGNVSGVCSECGTVISRKAG